MNNCCARAIFLFVAYLFSKHQTEKVCISSQAQQIIHGLSCSALKKTEMREFFKDIFEYHNHFNQKLADLLIANSDNISERTIPLFSHSINAHQIWNSRILETEPLAVHQIHTLKKCKELDNLNYNGSLKILSDFNLNKNISYKNSKGNEFENSIQQILFHIANHFTHHKGQIISDLRQNGIEPIITDYIFYKR